MILLIGAMIITLLAINIFLVLCVYAEACAIKTQTMANRRDLLQLHLMQIAKEERDKQRARTALERVEVNLN